MNSETNDEEIMIFFLYVKNNELYTIKKKKKHSLKEFSLKNDNYI